MNRRNLLFRGALAALAFAVPMTPAVGQQQPDLSRKAVVDDPVAPKRAGTPMTSPLSSSSTTTAPIAVAWSRC